MASKMRFAADSDFTGERCNIRFDHSGNITLAPPEAEAMRSRPTNKDPSTTDYISPDIQQAALPPACVTFIVAPCGQPTLGEAAGASPSATSGAGVGASNEPINGHFEAGRATVNLNGLSSARSTAPATPQAEVGSQDSNYGSAACAGGGGCGGGQGRKALLTVFFQAKSDLAVPAVPVMPRINFLSKVGSLEAPKDQSAPLPSPDLLRLAGGPSQDTCPFELRARNIEPRIHITATGNSSICTFSTSLHDAMLFDQNGAAVGPKYGRAFGVLGSMNIRGLSPTAVCMSHICALVTAGGDVMSPPSSPLAKNISSSGGGGGGGGNPHAYSPFGVGGCVPVGSPGGGGSNSNSCFINQHYHTADEGAMRHKILEDSLDLIAADYTRATAGLPPIANPKTREGAARARIAWKATKDKDDALINASKYTATIAFEPILFIGVNSGSIDVISLATQKELFRFNTGDIKGSKVIEGYACSAIECVHSMAQSSVTAILKAAHAAEARKWASGGCGSTRNYTPRGGNSGQQYPSNNNGNANVNNGASGTSNASMREEAMGASATSASAGLNGSASTAASGGIGVHPAIMSSPTDAPIRSVYAAGFDNGEVLLLALSKTSGELLRKVSYGTRPITSIRVGCLPWELHVPHPHSKQHGRNFHRPNDVSGAGAGACGRDFFQLVWQQRDELLFEMSHPADVRRLVGPPPVTVQGTTFVAWGGNNSNNAAANANNNNGTVSLTPPHSLSEASSILGDDESPSGGHLGGGGRYPEDRRNEPLHKVGASPSPPRRLSHGHQASFHGGQRGGVGISPTRAAPPKAPSDVPHEPMPQNTFGAYAVPPCHLPTASRLSSAAFLRRVAFWNNFAIVTTTGGELHIVATTLSDAGERAEVRTLEEVSMRRFRSFGAIVASQMLFSVAPGSLAHAECARRDPIAHRQQLAYLALTTQSNNLLIFRLAFCLNDDLRPGYGIHHTLGGVSVGLVAQRSMPHVSYINSLAVCALPDRAFGFAGANEALVGTNTGEYHLSGAPPMSDPPLMANVTPPRTSAGLDGQSGGRIGRIAGMSRGGDWFQRSGAAVVRSSGLLDGTITGGLMDITGGGGGGEGYYYEPLMPFMLVGLGIDQKISFWICEASLEPPLTAAAAVVGGDGALARTRSDRYAVGRSRAGTAVRNNSSFGGLNNTIVAGGVGHMLMGTPPPPPPGTAAPPPNAAGVSAVSQRLPIAFSLSQEEAYLAVNQNPKDFEPWTAIASCVLDGHQTFVCLGLRGRAKFFDCEIEEHNDRAAFNAAAANAAAAAAAGAREREGRETSAAVGRNPSRKTSF